MLEKSKIDLAALLRSQFSLPENRLEELISELEPIIDRRVSEDLAARMRRMADALEKAARDFKSLNKLSIKVPREDVFIVVQLLRSIKPLTSDDGKSNTPKRGKPELDNDRRAAVIQFCADAAKFVDWAVGEGITPPARSNDDEVPLPDDIMLDFSKATDVPFENVAEYIRRVLSENLPK